jgi:NADP-dependent 3-hydroxy acid dehydrogenase YdfG
MKQQDITGKWALVTGAGSGMGRTTSLELARAGANLILVDICGEAVGSVAKEAEALGAEVHTYCSDLTDWDQVKGMADTINARWGAVDILINNAGIAHMSYLVDTTFEDWKKLWDINVWTVIYMVRAFAPAMMKKKSGQIVNVSSGQAFFPVPTWGAYAVSKFAVDGYSEALSRDRTHAVLRLDHRRADGQARHEVPDGHGHEARGDEQADRQGHTQEQEDDNPGDHVAGLYPEAHLPVAFRDRWQDRGIRPPQRAQARGLRESSWLV